MRDLNMLTAALAVIEEKIGEPLDADALAHACFSSYSGLNKMFRYAFGSSIGEYIIKRRLSLAARALIESDTSIIDVALTYQYGSPEAFSRAFKLFFGLSPSAFRKSRRFSELQPKYTLGLEGGYFMADRKRLDVSELYDTLRGQAGTYALCIDIVEFMRVNDEYGYEAGDKVLAEVFALLDNAVDASMLLFRVGGDEFAIATGFAESEDALALAQRITAHNGETVKYKNIDIPRNLRVGIALTPKESFSYRQSLEILYKAMHTARENRESISLLTE